jgi:hypothetical protein
VNTNKSCAVAIGTWDTTLTVLNIPYQEHTTILGFHTAKTVREAAEGSWRKTMGLIRAHAQGSYGCKMTLDRRILYVHTYLLARTWHITQFYPPPESIVRQVNTTIAWFIWKGDIFRVPVTTLYRNKRDGGWELIDWASKCQTLFLYQTRHAMERKGTITAEWFRQWNLCLKGTNPPNRGGIPKCMEYLRHFAMASAYIK